MLTVTSHPTSDMQEYEALPGVLSVRPRRGLGRGRGRLADLRNTWWVRVQEDRGTARSGGQEMSNLTSQRRPLYHRDRNNTQNSLWEDHCGLH